MEIEHLACSICAVTSVGIWTAFVVECNIEGLGARDSRLSAVLDVPRVFAGAPIMHFWDPMALKMALEFKESICIF